MAIYQLSPQDFLCFPNSPPKRPAFNSPALGAGWPHPSVIFDAFHAALHRAFPQVQLWEHPHAFGKNGCYPNRHENSQRFGSLTTSGPFPCKQSWPEPYWLFPRPADVLALQPQSAATLLPLRNPGGRHNLPAPLRYPLGNPCPPDLEPGAPWWSKAALEAYLGHTPPDPADLWPESELFDSGRISGRGIDAAEGSPIEDRLHSAGYLRLGDNFALGVLAELPLADLGGVEGLDKLWPNHRELLVLGGRQRVCRIQRLPTVPLERLLPMSAPVMGDRMKWLLLAPAIFPAIPARERSPNQGHPGGWLPNWISPEPYRDKRTNVAIEAGQVLLKKGPIQRQPGESREQWRQRVRHLEGLNCRLVAARIPEPLVITGWSERRHLLINAPELGPGPKPTYLAVPAGAVYYFEGPDAAELADALAWHGAARQNIQKVQHRRSTLLGEKGFGLGVCGPWKFYDE